MRLEHMFSTQEPVDLRSVSKPVLSMTLGALIKSKQSVGKKPLSLNSRVAPLLDRHFASNGFRKMWKDVEIRHLISNTIGHENGFLFRKDLQSVSEEDYLGYALGQPIVHKPGSHFSYSNVGPFLLSVIIQDHLGASLHEIASDLVLRPLGIEASWRNYGQYTAGCTGLSMTGEDLLTFGEMLLAEGSRGSRLNIVDHDWVVGATSLQVRTPGMFDRLRVFPKFGYGYGFWVCENGSYYCDGTDGQYLIVVPSASLVMVTTGMQPDMKPITRCMAPLLVQTNSKPENVGPFGSRLNSLQRIISKTARSTR
ncbi:hypothetical protein DDA93_15565 [Arthrobacter sp. Bz4]|nr:hypothetical protein DDA93_15565 [Arthrobacter sp. Bz4]